MRGFLGLLRVRDKAASAGLILVFLLAACAAPTVETPTVETPTVETPTVETPTVAFEVSAGSLAVEVARAEGLFEGVDVEVTVIGGGEQALFLAGDAQLTDMSPWEVASFVSEGEPLRFLSTAGSINMINGIAIRAEDAEKYAEIQDLVGQTLGNPGFGSGTWAAFQVLVKDLYGMDAMVDFENVTAESGALLGLLEAGQIEAALLFSGATAAVMAADEFELIFSFTDNWREATGHPLAITGLSAKADWAEANPELVAALIEGIDRGVAWIMDNPHEFQEGGKYAAEAEMAGWLRDDATTQTVHSLLERGEWFFTSEQYTADWVDSVYGYIEAGVGIFVTELPEKDEIFYRTEP